ncbi:hypothetical protein [Saccharibacillus brassicae]|uniref:Uncharacterized protein n=1 Tax=Saccharibacillus brassicae TaxID=2583377 RepID=A0A4Y6USU2_SACBS|nr:hypothetical protein [Saccharibacillus brassicae]QDH19718.1 hypothetical protein FFV09_01860 [Saccharibacillus brassicae]
MRKRPYTGNFTGPRYIRRKPQSGDVLTGVLIVPPSDTREEIRREVKAFITHEKTERTSAEQARINDRIASLTRKIARQQTGNLQ